MRSVGSEFRPSVVLFMPAGIYFLYPLGESCLCRCAVLGWLMARQIANGLDAVVGRHPGRVQYNVVHQRIGLIEVERGAHRT